MSSVVGKMVMLLFAKKQLVEVSGTFMDLNN